MAKLTNASMQRISKACEKANEKQEAREFLLKILKPNDTVYTSLDSVSQSGMSRRIGLYVARVNEDGKPYIQRITWQVCKVLDYPYVKDSLRVGGCGMDMGFHVVYSLSRVLFDKNFHCIGEGCPSNDHTNGDFDRSAENVGRLHSDAGYALNQSWL